jgi:hypothetical protein
MRFQDDAGAAAIGAGGILHPTVSSAAAIDLPASRSGVGGMMVSAKERSAGIRHVRAEKTGHLPSPTACKARAPIPDRSASLAFMGCAAVGQAVLLATC